MRKQAEGGVSTINFELMIIKQKLQLLEEKVFKKLKRLRATEAQRFLLMYHLDLLDPIIQNNLFSQNQKDLVVAVMLDIDPDNSRKFLSELSKKVKPLLYTESNYNFLVSFFEGINYKEKLKTVDRILIKIRNNKEK